MWGSNWLLGYMGERVRHTLRSRKENWGSAVGGFFCWILAPGNGIGKQQLKDPSSRTESWERVGDPCLLFVYLLGVQ